MESVTDSVTESIKTCVHSVVRHLHCDIVTMTSGKAETQKRYIARLNADPQNREGFLINDRLRKKSITITQYDRKHDYREEPEIQRIQLKKKSDAEFLNQ